jgi:hypothetical protein
MSYRTSAVKAIEPLFSVTPWLVQLSTTSWPFTHNRTPSSLCV